MTRLMPDFRCGGTAPCRSTFDPSPAPHPFAPPRMKGGANFAPGCASCAGTCATPAAIRASCCGWRAARSSLARDGALGGVLERHVVEEGQYADYAAWCARYEPAADADFSGAHRRAAAAAADSRF